jgi:hypothetical protein
LDPEASEAKAREISRLNVGAEAPTHKAKESLATIDDFAMRFCNLVLQSGFAIWKTRLKKANSHQSYDQDHAQSVRKIV